MLQWRSRPSNGDFVIKTEAGELAEGVIFSVC